LRWWDFFFGTFLPGAAGGDLSKLFYTTRASGGRHTEIMTDEWIKADPDFWKP
jgi:hypothetical protein